MNLEQYLYVDERRLNSYVEQITSPMTSDKVPVFTIELSLTGPKAGGTQQRPVRLLTEPEKINLLLQHLTDNDLLGEGRFNGLEAFAPGAKLFRLETCESVKVFIPPASPESLIPDKSESAAYEQFLFEDPTKDRREATSRRDQAWQREREGLLAQAREATAGFSGINLWISDRHHAGETSMQKRGQLFLIAGFPKSDEKSFGTWSAYSAMSGLLSELRGDLAKSVLHPISHEHNNPTSEFQKHFRAEPLESLRRFGAQIGSWRGIKALYRVRDAILYKEPDQDAESIATIGYPIYIASTGF